MYQIFIQDLVFSRRSARDFENMEQRTQDQSREAFRRSDFIRPPVEWQGGGAPKETVKHKVQSISRKPTPFFASTKTHTAKYGGVGNTDPE